MSIFRSHKSYAATEHLARVVSNEYDVISQLVEMIT